MTLLTAEVAIVILLATTVRSTFGFGEALVAVPLLALVIPVKIAVPVAVLTSVSVAALVILQDWRHVHFRSAARLVVSTMFGIPLGLYVLKMADENLVKCSLGCAILAFSFFSLAKTGRLRLKDDRFAWLFGFAAGILGGAYGINGPPLAVYGSLRRWPPAKFRATLQGYFLPASLAGIYGYAASGLWTQTVSKLYLWSVPSIVLGALAGRRLNQKLNAEKFHRALNWGLILIGFILLVQSSKLLFS